MTCLGGLGRWIDDWAVVAWALIMISMSLSINWLIAFDLSEFQTQHTALQQQ